MMHLQLGIGMVMYSEMSDDARWIIVGHVQDILKFTISMRQDAALLEHGDAIAHVFEGDPKFLLSLADFIRAVRSPSRPPPARRSFPGAPTSFSEKSLTSWRKR